MKPTVSIVIPNYNGVKVLNQNLPWVIKHSSGAELIVVDDASTDDSIALVKTKFPQVKLIKKSTNTGFADSCNLGVKKAKGEIVVLLNHDVYPQAGWLRALLVHFTDPQVFAVGCLEKDGRVERGRGVGCFQRGFLVHARGRTDKTDTLWVSGGSGAFRQAIWQQLGGFDRLYAPFYWEDIDLSYRALKAGYKLVFEPQSRVVHLHEQGAIRRRYSPAQIKTVAYSNQLVFFWKNVTEGKLIISHCFWMPYHFISALLRQDWPFFRGFFRALLKLPQVYQHRQQAVKKFKLTDLQAIKVFK